MFSSFKKFQTRVAFGYRWVSRKMAQDQDRQEEREVENKVSGCERILAELGFTGANKVGEGAFGSVYLGSMDEAVRQSLSSWINIDDQTIDQMSQHGDVAVKILWNVKAKISLRSFWKEVDQVKRINHPNIVRHYAEFQFFGRRMHQDQSGRHFELLADPVLEPVPSESLHCVMIMEKLGEDISTAKTKLVISMFNEEEISHWYRCIGSALAYIHRLGVTHGDLGLRNMAFARPLQTRKDFTRVPIKLIDFGCARVHEASDYQSAKLIGLKGLELWDSEEKFLQIEQVMQPRPSNAFTFEAYLFARLLMRHSLPKRCNFSSFNSPDLPVLFGQHSSVKLPSLRKALILMAVKDERIRLTVEQALDIYS